MNANITDANGNVVNTKMNVMRMLVQRMSSIATRLVPDGKGAHLRFINSDYRGDDLNADQIDQKMQFRPQGQTRIGENLEKKILDPLIYKELDERSGKLERPYLILTITDGGPDPEPKETFKNSVVTCGKRLNGHQYPQESVMFLVSQIGNDAGADQFLDSITGDAAIDRVLFCTSGTFMTPIYSN
ncbi:hypothetical protein F4805DRAFT_106773 [Annulohypoxylon moriforme]|nr:hypothetical protein F4805DRAFT_106773 [Annulohypoxylon moriforme]